jgi:hypothetical protein
MSGSPLSPIALDSTPKVTFAEIALQNSCPSFPTLQFVRCMQERKIRSLVLADDRLIVILKKIKTLCKCIHLIDRCFPFRKEGTWAE